MGIIYADKPYQPGEKPRLEIKFTPGVVIATGDSLTGTPTVKVYRMSDRLDVTSDITGPPAIAGVLVGTPERVANSVFVKLGDWVDGEDYDVKTTCDTTNGEEDIEIDLIIQCREYP